MSEIKSTYDPALVEDKWYSHWMDKNYFHSEVDDREPYCIVIPPPNVTGVLHMGHMLNNTIQDILIRRARLQGKNACWVPGTDHASISTEAKVVKMLADKGINKRDIGREAFLQHAHEWKDKYGGIILEQLKKLGASCDWERTRFTMEERLSKAVVKVFIDLYEKGHIYRGYRMTNWDPKAQTALSDEEVIHREVNAKLYYVTYSIKNSDQTVTIATTRPETILADTAVCVHPDDERYKKLEGATVIIPIANHEVPLIKDDYVDPEFGTGALKITPAHDPNDYTLGQKHNLPTIDMLNADGTLNEHGLQFEGLDREEARKEIVRELEKTGQLVKVEELVHKVGYSERTHVPIEPRLTLQWFVDMKKLAQPALDNVMNDNIRFHPAKFKNTYRHWMENIKDWCISRQLWWGQQIPAWYYGEDDVVVAETEKEALAKARKVSGNAGLQLNDLRRDEDVVDTWFSSWLWPISVFDGFEKDNTKAQTELDYYYPTSALVTAPDIIFFWVARMIMSGYEYMGEKPFSHVYFTGLVRDGQRRKMSKSLGNSPDPLELITKYGADGVRVGMLLSAPAGNDLLFDEKLCEQGRNFCNKIWNAMRLVKGWTVEEKDNADDQPAINWFGEKLNEAKASLEKSFADFRISEALMTCYNLFWDDFASWYLEFIKPKYGECISAKTLESTLSYFEELMQILHPFMPFITEEVWHTLRERQEGDDVIVSSFNKGREADTSTLKNVQLIKEIVTAVREVRAKNNLKNRDTISAVFHTNSKNTVSEFMAAMQKLCNIDRVEFSSKEQEGMIPLTVGSHQLYIDTGIEIDAEAEKAKLEEELKYAKGFLNSVQKKLSNQRFMANAPEAVIAKEKQKESDALAQIKALEESLGRL